MKKNNQFLNIAINIIIPMIILTKFSKEEYLGPLYGLLIALSLPLSYGLYEFIALKQKSFTSILGFIGVLFSGVIGLLKFPLHWIAVKEAAVPLIIGLIVLYSTKKPWQLITKFLYNPELLNVEKIEGRLSANGLREQFYQSLSKANMFLSYSFFLSAILNYVLAKIIVQSMPGSVEFNEEIGRMTMLSFPVIVLPSIIIMLFIFKYLFKNYWMSARWVAVRENTEFAC